MGRKNIWAVVLFVILVFAGCCCEILVSTTVTYDGKALVIDGKRRILQSGSIHYPRTTPEYYFEGRFDLVKFVKTVQEAGLLVHLRIGPYACAEWNYGGFPLWLHFIPGIQFRTTNDLFKDEMKRFLAKIVDLMKEENLFASQGGPIILAQVENEYGNVEGSYGIGGKLYVKWAAETAMSLNTTVPWVMCVQEDAPDPIINTCNGFYCDRFTPNSPSKPKMWTENYTGWFLAFGNAIPYRPVEDLAFAVARFFETGGTFQNYYMYFGGTNFGRTAGGPMVATSYDYDAPLDEYGFIRQPKWGHLRDLHMSIKKCEKYLVNADPVRQPLGSNLEAHVYYKSSNDCAAFLANYDNSLDANVTFNGNLYFLPAWSVSILPDCRNVIFNTAKVVAQRNLEDATLSFESVSELSLTRWSWYIEKVGVWGNNSFTASKLLEQINTTKDTSDFLWYTTSINVNENNKVVQEKEALLIVESLGHAALVFVNKRLNYGPWFDIDGAGIHSVVLADMKNVKGNLSSTEWTYQVGLEGEYLGLGNISLANSSLWIQGSAIPVNESLIWYKATFLLPEGKGPLAVNLSSMGKGQAWVNGQSIGRYWPAYHSPSTGCSEKCDYRGSYQASKCQKYCGQPAQTLYHIPRTWVHSGENLLVLHEELGGDPSRISFSTRAGQEICAHVSEFDPPPVDSWKLTSEFISPEVRLACERGWQIASVSFASFGTPTGHCGAFSPGSCHANVLLIVQKACIGKQGCSVPVSTSQLGDPCPGELKSLAIQALCCGK
ncbi:hypothetical protein RHMOL_Rhmol13G0229200 [Rhododendron molle]|uniref:Uncharacterized protein n=1 Tax=Rhododendron molle TaxID=49168 RepID=A0ACC0L9N6_RHOML|nr:hypothetical protein RHMOL_Rhmol13G0229200 [Rhododendron molle]